MTENTEQQTNPETVNLQPVPASAKHDPDVLFKGRRIKREELPEEQVQMGQEAQDLADLYSKLVMEFKEGQIVKGKIISINDKEISVDIGFKSEGTVPREEFPKTGELTIGDDVEVYLDRVEDISGQLSLSKRKADFLKTWDRIKEVHESGEIVTGTIQRRIKGGFVVDLMGIDAFLPGSQIDVHPVRDFDALVGQDMEFRIVKLNDARKNIVVSRKVIVEESLKEVREKLLGDLKVDDVMEGTVKNITDFGVFVDLGGVDGLLHITDLSWGRVGHPSELVELDQKLTVKVLDYDKERQRISVGMKQLQTHPWEGVEEKYPEGARVKGKVVSIARYGAFVELEKGLEGLVHISEMSWTQHVKHPSAILSVGDEIDIVVLNIDKENRKISLGMKQTEPDPWENLETKYAVGTRHTGKVHDLVPFGAFIELEDGIDGLVHISDLSWTKRVRHPGEILTKGDEVEVVILGFDRNERRIALGLKQAQENPWDVFESLYAIGQQTTGKVIRVLDKGVVVELPQDVEGFVPASQLKRITKGSKAAVTPEMELNLEVIEFNKEAKKIILAALAPEGEETDEEGVDEETMKQYVVGSDVSDESSVESTTGESSEPAAADNAAGETDSAAASETHGVASKSVEDVGTEAPESESTEDSSSEEESEDK
ncbi:30S ribosomal protein S1 [bacterium]|nr:30S ribosomal protein S1 [bacterium]